MGVTSIMRCSAISRIRRPSRLGCTFPPAEGLAQATESPDASPASSASCWQHRWLPSEHDVARCNAANVG
eukprot:3127571-Pyramimonas_sp.AAC.1